MGLARKLYPGSAVPTDHRCKKVNNHFSCPDFRSALAVAEAHLLKFYIISGNLSLLSTSSHVIFLAASDRILVRIFTIYAKFAV